jgi:hypothetical protein
LSYPTWSTGKRSERSRRPKPVERTRSNRLLGIVPLSDFTVKPVIAHPGTVELSHDKPVFFNEIENGFVFVGNSLEPFVLVNVTLDNIYLSSQDIMKMFAFVEHRESKSSRYGLKS